MLKLRIGEMVCESCNLLADVDVQTTDAAVAQSPLWPSSSIFRSTLVASRSPSPNLGRSELPVVLVTTELSSDHPGRSESTQAS